MKCKISKLRFDYKGRERLRTIQSVRGQSNSGWAHERKKSVIMAAELFNLWMVSLVWGKQVFLLIVNPPVHEDLAEEATPPLGAWRGPCRVSNRTVKWRWLCRPDPAVTRPDLTGCNCADVGSGCRARAATAAKEQLRSLWLLNVIRSAGDVGCFCPNKTLGGFHLQPADAEQALNIGPGAEQWPFNQTRYHISSIPHLSRNTKNICQALCGK